MSEKKSGLPPLSELVSDKRLALMLALGFSSGLPFLLIFSTQSAWLREAGVSLTEIGFMSWVTLAFALKFLWAPLIDAFDPPIVGARLGRRRGWMLLAQLGVMACLAGIAFGDPAHRLIYSVLCSASTAFCAATQDVVIDGWRIDAAPIERQGMMSAVYALGYRLALICAGAGALYLADFFSWRVAYLSMAALMIVGIGACLLASKPAATSVAAPGGDTPPKEAAPAPKIVTSFIGPLTDLWQRNGKVLVAILLLVALYRLPDFISGVMTNPLYIDLGFSKSDIATMSKLYGVWIGIAGAFGGGFAVARLGMLPTLLIGGIAASASHLTLALLAASGHRFDLLMLAVSVESFAGAFAGTALVAYMSSLTSPAFAAAQYALLSSLYALPGKVVGGFSGLMAQNLGYPTYFVMSASIGIPVTLLCLLVWRSQMSQTAHDPEPEKLAIRT